MRIIALLALTLLPFLPYNAYAQCAANPVLDMPEGHVMMSISATERLDVEQDLLVASLSYVTKNRDPSALQNEINTVMQKALKEAKGTDNVKVETGAYQVYETTDPRTKERKWQGQQAITLKSKDADALLTLAGKLQGMKLTTTGLNYVIDPETAAQVQDSLMEAALIKLQKRADRAAKAMNKSTADLRTVTTQNASVPYRPTHSRAMMMESAAADMAMPVASAGDTTISLTVTAQAILKP